MKKILLVAISALLLTIPFSSVCGAAENGQLKVGGASLYSDVLEKFSEEFQKAGKGCRPAIAGSTTGKGISEFINGESVLVAASRSINAKEREQAAAKGIQVSETLVGKTSLAVVTNIANPVSEVSMEQLRKIFSGEISNWKEVGGNDEPIRVTIRAVPETGAGVLFQEVVLKGAPYAPNSQVMQSYKTTLTVVGKSSAIGYLPTTSSYYDKMGTEGVKEIKIRMEGASAAISAPAGLVKDTSFPISIPLVFIWNGAATDSCVSGFMDFVKKAIDSNSMRAKASSQM